MATPTRPDRAPAGYRTAWGLVAGLTVAGGLFGLFRELPWESATAIFLTASLLAASCTLSADAVTTEDIDLRHAGVVGGFVGVVVLVLVGLALVAGTAGALWWGGVLVVAPGTLRRLRGWLPWTRAPRTGGPPPTTDDLDWLPPWERTREDAAAMDVLGSVTTAPDPPGGPPAEDRADTDPDWSPSFEVSGFVTDEDLCLAWESSSRALTRCEDAEARQELVRVRQACLDELERRRPDAVRAWVLSGVDVESGPGRFLSEAG